MRSFDRVCPVCGQMNRGLYLDETNGFMECERCREVSFVLLQFPEDVSKWRSRRLSRPVGMMQPHVYLHRTGQRNASVLRR